ncbi:ACT domain-containing protein [Corynebacterium suedekumii]|nr:ACT domain-containing protein [Corynebacterium suedekumii]
MDTATESTTHRSAVEVKAIAADGSTASVVGALTGLDRVEKFVRIDDRGLDMRAEGRNLFLQYTDAPGALGKVGSLLGDAGINIEAAALTQAAKGDGATLILRVDAEVPEELEQTIAESLGATAIQLNLD